MYFIFRFRCGTHTIGFKAVVRWQRNNIAGSLVLLLTHSQRHA